MLPVEQVSRVPRDQFAMVGDMEKAPGKEALLKTH